MQKTHLEEVAAFIRDHRSSEAGFGKLYAKLKEERRKANSGTSYHTALEAAEKKADEYGKVKETGGTAWPEYEKFVSEFERAVVEASKQA